MRLLKKPRVVWILLAAVTFVWGIILLQIFAYFSEDPDNTNVIENNHSTHFDTKDDKYYSVPDNISIDYIKLGRDPFSFGKNVDEHIGATVVPNNRKYRVKDKILDNNATHNNINYKINGVIINSENKIVVFEDLTNNKTRFLKEGDTYINIVINEISKKSVSLTEGGNTSTIAVQ